MRKNVLKVLDLPSNGTTAALVIMAVVFFVGGLAGCTLAGRAEGGGEAALNGYLDGFLNVVASGEMVKPEFILLLWKSIRWPLFVVILGFTPIGLIGVPLLFLVRAFLLSFSIASFFHVSGVSGLLFAFSVFGITGLIYVPVLFLLGIQSFLNAGTIIGRITGENRRGAGIKRTNVFCCCVCFLLLFVCCFIEYSAGPAFLKMAAEMLNH